MTQDDEHLRLLSIFHYVVAAMTGLFASFPLIHIVLGLLMLFNPDRLGGETPPAFVGWLFVGMGAALVTLGWTLAGCMIAVGRSLARRRWYTFCLVVAAVECLVMPFGTILGVFTLIVLMRESVKEAFRGKSQPAPA